MHNDDLAMLLGAPAPQQMMPMPGAMGGGGRSLWPNGCGISDRDSDPDSCSCPPIANCFPGLCAIPIWFRDKWAKAHGAEGKLIVKKCTPGWTVDADLMNGQRGLMELKAMYFCFKCGVEECCGTEVHYTEAGHLIARGVQHFEPCALCKADDWIISEAKDSTGKSRFARVGGSCCRRAEYRWESVKGNWIEQSHPIYASAHLNKDPVAYITSRYHMHPCCPFPQCRPSWTGIKEFPSNLSIEDQKSLVALAMLTWAAGSPLF